MANSTKCLTNGAIFHTEISKGSISAKVSLPFSLDIDSDEAAILETLIHNSLEIILRPYFLHDDKGKSLDKNLESKISDILDKNESLSLDDKGDKEKLLSSISREIKKVEWWE
tara:strand:- start:5430 stop:5768 length:339 start_codon:yes stop_codon:yes gene_type:complete